MATNIAIFDGDGTLWKFPNEFGSSWSLVEKILSDEELRLWKKRSREFHDNFERRNDKEYESFLEIQVKLLQGKPCLDLENVKIPYREGAKELVERLKPSYDIYILSAGFYDVVEKAARELGVKHISNEIERKNGFYTGKIKKVVSPFNKSSLIRQLITSYSSQTSQLLLFYDEYDFDIQNFEANIGSVESIKKFLIVEDEKSKQEKQESKQEKQELSKHKKIQSPSNSLSSSCFTFVINKFSQAYSHIFS
ncbi:MAG: haloacid dehalogenase-like hydrolase [Candidatus Pacearchaeota archaeon]